MPKSMLNNHNPLHTRDVESSDKERKKMIDETLRARIMEGKKFDWRDVSYTCLNFTQVHFTLESSLYCYDIKIRCLVT